MIGLLKEAQWKTSAAKTRFNLEPKRAVGRVVSVCLFKEIWPGILPFYELSRLYSKNPYSRSCPIWRCRGFRGGVTDFLPSPFHALVLDGRGGKKRERQSVATPIKAQTWGYITMVVCSLDNFNINPSLSKVTFSILCAFFTKFILEKTHGPNWQFGFWWLLEEEAQLYHVS